MSELDAITTVIISWASGSAGAITAAPAQAVAEHIRDQVKERLDGTRQKGEKKAAGRALEMSDRVAYKVLTEAAFNDDEVVSDYLGGVLAASTHGDDRASAVVATIARLSAEQLKLHYVIYRAVAQLLPGPLNLHSSEECRKARVLIGNDDLIATLGRAPRILNGRVATRRPHRRHMVGPAAEGTFGGHRHGRGTNRARRGVVPVGPWRKAPRRIPARWKPGAGVPHGRQANPDRDPEGQVRGVTPSSIGGRGSA